MADFSLFKVDLGLPELLGKLLPQHRDVLPSKGLLEAIQGFICYSQGTYAEYHFLTSQCHKTLKDELRRNPLDKGELSGRLRALEDHLIPRTQSILSASAQKIQGYFNGRSHWMPRVCIKTHDDQGQIFDFVRGERKLFNEGGYRTQSHHVAQNTGFHDVYSSGRWYICNDIPGAARSGKYKNPRINAGAVKNYEVSKSEIKRLIKNHEYDKKWQNCWNLHQYSGGVEKPPSPESCYKSTMIIPMTLLNNDIGRPFKEHFEISNKDQRAIWGYLCFDHVCTDYFKEEYDVLAGYIFADILSLYLFTVHTYSSFSSSYREAKSILGSFEGGENAG